MSTNRNQKLQEIRQQQRMHGRRRIVLAVAAAVVAIALIAGGVTALVRSGPHRAASATSTSGAPTAKDQILPAAPTGPTTTQSKTNRVSNDSGIKGVLAWNTTGWPGDGKDHPGALEHNHVNGTVDYRQTPPVGGPHSPVWMNAGVYTEPIPSERAVHNMEHGAVWITYRPNLPASQAKQLVKFVGKQSLIDESAATQITGQQSRFMDLSPWKNKSLPAPIVLSAWGHQLRVKSPDDPRMQRFVDTFRHSKKYTPEYGAAVDGVPVQTGGRPAAYGATEPNPAGSADTQSK